MKKVKALVLLSGGLDSMLSARLLIEQGVEVTGINFTSHFFGAAKARKAAEQLGVKLLEVDFKVEHLAMVKQPKHGYGSNMNPCIDCHALMLRKTKEIMEGGSASSAVKYDFVATGEVLGQRPMSQNPEALKLVANSSGLGGRLLRPLSAKLLPLTEPEKEGKIIREKLLDIGGRSRKRQAELAAGFGLKDYPSPAGGCLLTDPSFSQRLKLLFENWPDCDGGDVELLKHGRMYWLEASDDKILLAIGRHKADNEALNGLARPGDMILELAEEVGPSALMRNYKSQKSNNKQKLIEVEVPTELKEDIFKKENAAEIAAMLAGYYAPRARGKKVKVNMLQK